MESTVTQSMATCSKCGKRIGLFSSYFIETTSDGKTAYLCPKCDSAKDKERRERERKQKQKEMQKQQAITEQLIEREITKIKTLLKTLFDTPLESEYVDEIVDSCFYEDKRYKDWWEWGFYEPNNVGHKARVIKKLRELDIIYNAGGEYSLGICEDADFEEALGERNFKSPEEKTLYCLIELTKILIIPAIEKNKRLRSHSKGNRYICSSCEYKWETKKKFGEPFKCPRCNSQNIISLKNLKTILEERASKYKESKSKARHS